MNTLGEPVVADGLQCDKPPNGHNASGEALSVTRAIGNPFTNVLVVVAVSAPLK